MTALVIGATGGIGMALAKALRERVSQLWLSGRNEGLLSELAQTLEANAVSADLGDEQAVQHLMAQVGDLDFLVYAAGAVVRAPVRQMSLAEWQQVLNANLVGAWLVLKHAQFRQGARALFLGVYPQLVRVQGLSAYAVSKAGLEELLQVARRELRGQGVSLILVRLPEVATNLWSVFGGPPRRALSPETVAQQILDQAFAEPAPEVIEIARPQPSLR